MAAKYVTFDCYGTLIDFQINQVLRETFGAEFSPSKVEAFLKTAAAYRFDEVLGPWKPYREVIANATRRAASRFGITCDDPQLERVYDAIGSWGPHPDVPTALDLVSRHYPLVILSNAAEDQIPSNVARLGAPIHQVFTAERARAYKPRFAAFEYMFSALDCAPEDVIHVSASIEYDQRPARDLGIGMRIFVNRFGAPPQPWLGYREIRDLGGLAAVLGIAPDAPGR